MQKIYNSYNHMFNDPKKIHGGFLIIHMASIGRTIYCQMKRSHFMKKLSLLIMKSPANNKKLERYLARALDK